MKRMERTEGCTCATRGCQRNSGKSGMGSDDGSRSGDLERTSRVRRPGAHKQTVSR